MTPFRLNGLGHWFAIAGVGAVMLAWTWGTWLDPFIDFGRELYLPWQIHEGQALYRNLASFSGPLSPYVNAGWFSLFGVGLRSLVFGNVIVAAILTVLLHRVVRTLSNGFTATVACLLFILLFAFGEYDEVGNFNYLTPYSHEVVHGIVLSFVSLTGVFAALDKPSVRRTFGCGLALGFVFLTKPEVFVAALAAHCAAGAFWYLTRRPGFGFFSRLCASWVSGLSVAPIGAMGLLSLAMAPATALAGMTNPYSYLLDGSLRGQMFYATMTGFAAPGPSVRRVLLATLAWVTVSTVMVLLAAKARRGWRVETLVGSVFVGFATAVLFNKTIVDEFARALPLLMVGIAVMTIRAALTISGELDPAGETILKRLAFVAFAGTLMIKVLMNAHIRGYGFALAMPATMVIVIALVDWAPAALNRRRWDGQLFRELSLWTLSLIVGLFLLVHKERIDASRHSVAAGADRFLSNDRALSLNASVLTLKTLLTPTDRLVVLPEGIMLNYLARRASSVPFTNFLPPEQIMFGGDGMFEALKESAPEFIAIVDRPMQEYGFEGFGVDYARPLADWVRENYEPVDVLEDARKSAVFGVDIFRRR